MLGEDAFQLPERGRPVAPRTFAGARTSTLLAMAVVVFALASSGAARAAEGCSSAISTAEQTNNDLPAHILRAIGVVETGRRDPLTGAFDAWPWSVNAAGDSRVFETRDQAIAFVQDAQARGIRSIDVGCMQINLKYHPNAFASLEQAFTPEANVGYAAALLLDLHERTGDWATATGDYHSATPGLSEGYARRVQAILNGELLAPALPALWTVPALPTSPVVMMSAAARRVQVIEPGSAPLRLSLLRGSANLPHVYHP
jgi:hypothetical protein